MTGIWTNPNRCFFRMISVYGSLGIMGVGSGSTCAYVAYCLSKHAEASAAGKNKKENRMMAAVNKLVRFGGFVGTACFVAFIARLRPLITPQPFSEVSCHLQNWPSALFRVSSYQL